MKTKRINLFILVALFVASIMAAMITLGVFNQRAKAQTQLVTFEQGASIRLDPASTGIRFACTFADNEATEAGMIIVPEFTLENYEAQKNTGYEDYFQYYASIGKEKAAISAQADNPVGRMTGVIHTILDANYNLEYGAVAYLYDGTSYSYYPCDFSRRIGDVANGAFLDTEKEWSEEDKNDLSGIITKAVNLTHNVTTGETLSIDLAVGKTVDLGQLVLSNYVSTTAKNITWTVNSGNDTVIKKGFLDNIQGLSVGTATLTASAYNGAFTMNVNVNVVNASKVEDVVDYVVEDNGDGALKVLQFSDIQILGDDYEEKAFKYMDKAVEDAENPDLIILIGDNIHSDYDVDGNWFKALVAKMDSYKIPWATVNGNHDNAKRYDSASDSYVDEGLGAVGQNEYFKKSEYCIYNQGVTDGNGNYTIGLKLNGEIQRVCVLMDTNYCNLALYPEQNNVLATQSGFSDNQMEWFDRTVDAIKATSYSKNISMFYHIPSETFATANALYSETKNNTTSYIIGANIESQNGDFGANYQGTFSTFDTDDNADTDALLQIFKTAGVDSAFVGHVHEINTSILYEGIRWTFGLKTGKFLAASETSENFGGTLSTTDSTGKLSVKHLYYNGEYQSFIDSLQNPENNGKLYPQGIPVAGKNNEIVYATETEAKTTSVEMAFESGELVYKVAYAPNGRSGYHCLQIDPALLEGKGSVSFKVMLKSGEVADNSTFESGGVNYYMWGVLLNAGGFKITKNDAIDKWVEVKQSIPINSETSKEYFNFMLASGTTMYIKDIQINDVELTDTEKFEKYGKVEFKPSVLGWSGGASSNANATWGAEAMTGDDAREGTYKYKVTAGSSGDTRKLQVKTNSVSGLYVVGNYVVLDFYIVSGTKSTYLTLVGGSAFSYYDTNNELISGSNLETEKWYRGVAKISTINGGGYDDTNIMVADWVNTEVYFSSVSIYSDAQRKAEGMLTAEEKWTEYGKLSFSPSVMNFANVQTANTYTVQQDGSYRYYTNGTDGNNGGDGRKLLVNTSSLSGLYVADNYVVIDFSIVSQGGSFGLNNNYLKTGAGNVFTVYDGEYNVIAGADLKTGVNYKAVVKITTIDAASAYDDRHIMISDWYNTEMLISNFSIYTADAKTAEFGLSPEELWATNGIANYSPSVLGFCYSNSIATWGAETMTGENAREGTYKYSTEDNDNALGATGTTNRALRLTISDTDKLKVDNYIVMNFYIESGSVYKSYIYGFSYVDENGNAVAGENLTTGKWYTAYKLIDNLETDINWGGSDDVIVLSYYCATTVYVENVSIYTEEAMIRDFNIQVS